MLRTLAVLAAACVLPALTVSPANAECLSAEASYSLLGGSERYLVGPKRCVVSTPYKVGFTTGKTSAGRSGVLVVSGQVWVPLPPLLIEAEDSVTYGGGGGTSDNWSKAAHAVPRTVPSQ